MRGSKQTLYHRFAGIVLRHPVAIILAAALGVVLALLVTATHLTFQTNRLDLIASGNYYRQLGEAYAEVTQFSSAAPGLVERGSGLGN
jgi:uncharacterized membrane protein YdfJ with MMPL/SSD domain